MMFSQVKNGMSNDSFLSLLVLQLKEIFMVSAVCNNVPPSERNSRRFIIRNSIESDSYELY